VDTDSTARAVPPLNLLFILEPLPHLSLHRIAQLSKWALCSPALILFLAVLVQQAKNAGMGRPAYKTRRCGWLCPTKSCATVHRCAVSYLTSIHCWEGRVTIQLVHCLSEENFVTDIHKAKVSFNSYFCSATLGKNVSSYTSTSCLSSWCMG